MNNLKKGVNVLFSQKYLFFTNTILGGSFLGSGDLIDQKLSNLRLRYLSKNDQDRTINFNFERTDSMFKSGLVFGSIGHFWYKFLDNKFPGKNKRTIIKKLLCEMGAGPPWIFMTFITVGFFEKSAFKESLNKFTGSFFHVLFVDWLFYVPLQTFNFLYIAPKFRFLYVAFLTLFYDTFLAYILHR